MTDLALTAAQIARVHPEQDEVYDMIAAATITAGAALYITSAGTVDLYDSNGSGTLQFCGIALNGGGAGSAIGVLKRGAVYGYTISGLAYFAPVYGSNSVGLLADSAGSSSNVVGRVMPLSDSNLTKVLYINAQWDTVFS